MKISFESLIIGIITFILLIGMIRVSKMRIKDSIFWIIWTFVLSLVAFVPEVGIWVKNLFRVNDPNIFVFLLIVIFTYIVLFRHTIMLSQHENKIKELSQTIAIQQLEQKKKNQEMDKYLQNTNEQK